MTSNQTATAISTFAPVSIRRSLDIHELPPIRIIRQFWKHRRHDRDYRHLMELPDYLLEDMGLTRERIRAMRQR